MRGGNDIKNQTQQLILYHIRRKQPQFNLFQKPHFLDFLQGCFLYGEREMFLVFSNCLSSFSSHPAGLTAKNFVKKPLARKRLTFIL